VSRRQRRATSRSRRARLAGGESECDIKVARQKSEALGATAGRTEARETLGRADDLFRDFDRMGEKVSGTESEAEAAAAFDREFESGPSREENLEDRLEELKRRMGKR